MEEADAGRAAKLTGCRRERNKDGQQAALRQEMDGERATVLRKEMDDGRRHYLSNQGTWI